jgi:hypothetical protein
VKPERGQTTGVSHLKLRDGSVSVGLHRRGSEEESDELPDLPRILKHCILTLVLERLKGVSTPVLVDSLSSGAANSLSLRALCDASWGRPIRRLSSSAASSSDARSKRDARWSDLVARSCV